MKHFDFGRSVIRRLAYALCLTLLVALAGCATGPKMAFHGFSFNGWNDQWGSQIDLLEYSYGDQYRMVRDKVQPPQEKLNPASSVAGTIPVGDFLYVKWRIKTTGEICENKVDLRPLLPKDMNDYGLTFVIDGKQLYIYLVTLTPKHEEDPPILKTTKSLFHVTYEIYPHDTFHVTNSGAKL